MPHALVTAAAKSTPFIDWAALGKVAGAATVFGLAVIVLFAVGIVGLGWTHGETAQDASGEPAAAGNRTLGAVLAAVCFVACAGAVGYGLWIIIPQFHR